MPAAGHLVAFERSGALTLATRLPVGLTRSGAGKTRTIDLGGPVVDVLTDRRHEGATRLADLLASYPVALLVRL